MLWIWVLVIVAAFYFYIFRRNFLYEEVQKLLDLPLAWRMGIFLALGCARGFTLVPVTYLIILGLVFLPATPAYLLTLAGVTVSSLCIYYFAEYIGLAGFFERTHGSQITKLKSVLQKNELPIVAAWSFMPVLPTDVMCYVCGSLRIDVKKFILGVLIGEGIACALYIYAGKELLLLIVHKIIGS